MVGIIVKSLTLLSLTFIVVLSSTGSTSSENIADFMTDEPNLSTVPSE